VAIPDFGNVAMENWGIMTFEEKLLFSFPPKYSSSKIPESPFAFSPQSLVRRSAYIIAHEISHQVNPPLLSIPCF
jgi:aminopeptidase N